ncbi:hypothetical protein C8034_v006943 [Colletotrichum sidae]|uniref:Zn(2)-C6 fungal-type domain-containing protein n=1 Tax=Colletotrichum sidae TaxID=1347389 RepID=A0A4R8T5Y0_9PEZI|nr:hypothetical protein C8034_v006943 [Colletotrichum sidae]
MDPGQPDSKRPRLSMNTPSSWSPTGGAPPLQQQQQQQNQLPPLHPPHPATTLPPTPHQPHSAHHPAPLSSYHPGPPSYPPRPADPHHPPHPAQHHPDERRHHEQESPYTPLQDHYRHPQSPSPAHPSYHPYPPRDPGAVKREPQDESLNHPRRPHSTGGAPPDGLPPPQGPHPPPPHSAPPPVPQYAEDPRRHMSYDSAPPQMPPTPGGYRSNYPPPQMSQQPPPQQYEPAPYHSQPPPESLYNVSYTSTQKRKATRASQACDSCRQLKAKCDETKPCKSCKEKGVECKYRDPVPKAIDKSQTDILESVDNLTKKMDQMEQRLLERVQEALISMLNPQAMKRIKVETDGVVSSPSPISTKSPPTKSAAYPVESYATRVEPQPMSVEESSYIPDAVDEGMESDATRDDDDRPPGPIMVPEAPSIPVNHTVTNSMLLQWPAIRSLTQPILTHLGIKHPEEFPLRVEEKRGLLKIFGRGEGSGAASSSSSTKELNVAAEQQQHGTVDAGEDSFSEPAASPSPSDNWGHVGSLSPPNLASYSSSTLTPDGNPDYSESKVYEYVESFKENILFMHPILAPKDLNNLVKRFLDTVNAERRGGRAQNPGVAKFANMHAEFSNKRKRSPGVDQPEEPVQPRKIGKPNRTIDSALVLVILALGKICLHRSKIPDPSEPPRNSQNSPMHRNGYPTSPGPGGQASPPSYSSHSHSSGLPSPKEHANNLGGNRRHSMQGAGIGSTSARRNYDIIPGLEYFAVASDIFGTHAGGMTLKHAQTWIFCGLYYGQLGRVLQSHSYLLEADKALQSIMRRDLNRFHKLKETFSSGVITDKRDNIMLLTYWTISQLESDILAELNLIQQPYVLKYENKMPWPNLELVKEDFGSRVAQGYFGQLYLRKTLNRLTASLYDPLRIDVDPMKKFEEGIYELENLRHMRWVGEEFRFSEDDDPATNIIDARLRAKYWGTQNIIYRLVIKMALDLSHQLKQKPPGASPEGDAAGTAGIFQSGDAASFIGHKVRTYDDLGDKINNFLRDGVRSLVKSTSAFHGIDQQRLLVTNIFGTAHAQWGNLLILAAGYRDPHMRQFIDGATLHNLFQRTIQMFKMHAHSTSALTHDMHVLEYLQRELFGSNGVDVTDPRMNTSFSSAASMTGPTRAPLAPPPLPVPQQPHPQAHPPPHPHQMSMAYAMQPNSASNSPSQVHRVLNHAPNHAPMYGHSYQGQPTPMQ